MKLSFHERGKKSDHEELESIVYFVLTKYLSFDNLYELKLKITIHKTSDQGGSCIPYGFLPYRSFDIYILNNENMSKHLIHELIHVKQIVNGEHIPRDDDNRLIWKGEDYTDEAYENLPWEIEAGELEEKLYEEWKNKA